MQLAKRARPHQMQRTTSMKGISHSNDVVHSSQPSNLIFNDSVVGSGSSSSHRLITPRYRMAVAPDNFLATCGFCGCRLSPRHDIYMYRGDTAFCSVECREEQMKHDERLENCCSSSSTSTTS